LPVYDLVRPGAAAMEFDDAGRLHVLDREANRIDVFAYPAGPFADVPWWHWARDPVKSAVAARIVAGYPDGGYHPGDLVTRDQMAVYIARGLVTPTGDAAIPDGPAAASFSDVSTSHWAYKWIEYAVARNVAKDTRAGHTFLAAAWTGARWLSTSRAQRSRRRVMPRYRSQLRSPRSRCGGRPLGLQQIEYCADRGVVKGYPMGATSPREWWRETRWQCAWRGLSRSSSRDHPADTGGGTSSAPRASVPSSARVPPQRGTMYRIRETGREVETCQREHHALPRRLTRR